MTVPRNQGPGEPASYRRAVTNPLLSSYRGGENRVTSSTLAVFERLDLALVRTVLDAALASATAAGVELETVTYANQPPGVESVPDAKISARFTWYFETKTVRGAYDTEGHGRQQVRAHSRLLTGEHEWLFVVTPDPLVPRWFYELDGVDDTVRGQVAWLGFRDLAEAVREVVNSPGRLLGEQTRFLLTELVAMYEAEGLTATDDTVVVAARSAWPLYQRVAAYVCQPDRAFREGLTYLGFYAAGAIQPLVPRILAHHIAVSFTREDAATYRSAGDADLAALIERLLDDGTYEDGAVQGVMLLSALDDPRTVRLAGPVRNDAKTRNGRAWAWTLGQRYVRSDRLTSGATVTSAL